MIKLTNPLKWHGGKSYLADWIISLMPKHLHYVEPYAGGLAVLLAKNPIGTSEVVNDLNGDLTNFWHTLQDENKFKEFKRIIDVTPFSKREWEQAYIELIKGLHIETFVRKALISNAVSFFIKCRQSRAGGFKSFATLSRNRVRRGMNEQVSAWLNCIDGLPDVHERLMRIVILNDDALKVIRQQDGPNTLFYLDPPYVHSTRSPSAIKAYQYEMTDDDHRLMLNTALVCVGHVMISGYRNDMYDLQLEQWNRHDKLIDNKVASSSTKPLMIESVWCNF